MQTAASANRQVNTDLLKKIIYDARPKLSVAAIDFGSLQRLGIPSLTHIERMAIAAGRVYQCVVQISGANAGHGKQPVLRGQTISFPQPDAPRIVAAANQNNSPQLLPRTDLNRIISLMFVGPKNQLEKWSTQPSGSVLMPRWKVLIRTLTALQRLGHPAYQNIEIDLSDSTRAYFEGSITEKGSFVFNLFDTCRVVDDRKLRDVDVVVKSSDPAEALPLYSQSDWQRWLQR